MFRRSLSLSLVLFAAACADGPPDVVVDRTYMADASGPLTGPSSAPATEIVAEFLRDTGRAAELDALDVIAEGTDRTTGRIHVRLEQWVDGLRVEGAYVKATLSAQGELLHLIDGLATVSDTALSAPQVDETVAIRGAMTGIDLDATTPLHRAPIAEPVAYVTDDGTLAAGYRVETWERASNLLRYTIVDGRGRLVRSELRTNSDSYNVFVEDPGKTPQGVVAGPGTAGNAESPAGWLAGAQTTTAISGNNTRAYLDADANNVADGGGAPAGTDFLTTADLGSAPSTAGNRAVAVQNLFYLNNVVHDVLYRHGFNEAAGNFQVNNFGLGGAGNDAVNAEAQDGGGTDNANFSTPADGSAPRMQMYLWSGLGPDTFVDVGAVAYDAKAAGFGPAITTFPATPIVVASPADGCTAVGSAVSGKIALIDRGSCDFTVKVMNAQNAGAVAVIVANNATGNPFTMGGTNRRIKIPSVMVAQATRASLVGVTGGFRKNPAPPLQIDASLDADIVFHEYGHGLTWRMVGGMSGKLAGAIGEGASDTLAFLINGDPYIAEYSQSSAGGIRRFSYVSYPYTYSAVTGASVHDDGEIYAAAMWDVRGNYLAAGLTTDDVLGDWVEGMNATPATPTFESMRDGMLVAAPAARDCLIWRGFAARGVGVGAKGVVSKGGRVTITESFALPLECQ